MVICEHIRLEMCKDMASTFQFTAVSRSRVPDCDMSPPAYPRQSLTLGQIHNTVHPMALLLQAHR